MKLETDKKKNNKPQIRLSSLMGRDKSPKKTPTLKRGSGKSNSRPKWIDDSNSPEDRDPTGLDKRQSLEDGPLSPGGSLRKKSLTSQNPPLTKKDSFVDHEKRKISRTGSLREVFGIRVKTESSANLATPNQPPSETPTVKWVKISDERKILESATLSQLVDAFISEPIHTQTLNHLLLGCPHFFSPRDFMKMINEKLSVVDRGADTYQSSGATILMKVSKIIQQWITAMYRNYIVHDAELLKDVNELVSAINKLEPTLGSILTSLINNTEDAMLHSPKVYESSEETGTTGSDSSDDFHIKDDWSDETSASSEEDSGGSSCGELQVIKGIRRSESVKFILLTRSESLSTLVIDAEASKNSLNKISESCSGGGSKKYNASSTSKSNSEDHQTITSGGGGTKSPSPEHHDLRSESREPSPREIPVIMKTKKSRDHIDVAVSGPGPLKKSNSKGDRSGERVGDRSRSRDRGKKIKYCRRFIINCGSNSNKFTYPFIPRA